MPCDFASRLRGPMTAHPVPTSDARASVRAPACGARGSSCACSPRPRGAREEQSAAVPAAEARAKKKTKKKGKKAGETSGQDFVVPAEARTQRLRSDQPF